MNYFELFAISLSFDIDLSQLSTAFQALQKTVHPDRFAHTSSQEQLLAVQKSATINNAYQTLKNPLKRAEYMLELRGTNMPSEQASFRDTLFLMRQMELREMLEELKNATDIDIAFEQAAEELDSEYQNLFCQLQDQLSGNTTDSDQRASEILRKLKFYQKLQVELDKIEEQLFD